MLTSFNYRKDRQRGSRVVLKYTNPDTDEKRTVTVPLHDRVRIGTLHSIAEECDVQDFDAWCRWIDEHRYHLLPARRYLVLYPSGRVLSVGVYIQIPTVATPTAGFLYRRRRP